LRSLFAALRSLSPRRSSYALSFEALEDRAVPATLATHTLVEGPTAGTDSDVVTVVGPWNATANASWLHITTSSGNGLAKFTFDANTGPTRTGTLTIAGETLTVTQAGSTYVPANPLKTLVSTGLDEPSGVVVDGLGNVYFADSGNKAIEKYNATTHTVTTLVSTGLFEPYGVALDGSGNVYVADAGHNAIKEYNVKTDTVVTLISTGLDLPEGVAVDGSGNVYIADESHSAIKEYNATTHTVVTLVSTGLNTPVGVAVDGTGNVYIADSGNRAIKEYNATTHAVTTLVSTGLYGPLGVVVDGSGNVYIADIDHNLVEEYNVATNAVAVLDSTGLDEPFGVAVDGSGNVYFTDFGSNDFKELPRAFVSTAPINETAAAGRDSLLPVLPTTESLTGVFKPTSNQSWLTIGTITNGVVNFSFTANTAGTARTATITELGQQITVTQAGHLERDGQRPGGLQLRRQHGRHADGHADHRRRDLDRHPGR
jgi:streptogramin lyase